MPESETRRVYSTDGNRVEAAKPASLQRAPRRSGGQPAPSAASGASFPDDGVVRLRREKSGRGGKTVTVAYGLAGSEAELDDLLKILKQRCGAGGTRDGRRIEIQGDHRARIEAELTARGIRVKQAGG